MKTKIIGITIVLSGVLLVFLIFDDNQSHSQNNIINVLSSTTSIKDASSTSSTDEPIPLNKRFGRKTIGRSNLQISQSNVSNSSFTKITLTKRGSEMNGGVVVPMENTLSITSKSGRNSNASKDNGEVNRVSVLHTSRLFSSSTDISKIKSVNEGAQGLLASNSDNLTTHELNAENGGIMRAPNGGGELPPPEGTPLGSGLWLLIGAASIYGIKKYALCLRTKSAEKF